MSCRCFLGLSRSAINHLTSTRRDLIYFIYFTLQNKAVIPKEYVAKANANKGKKSQLPALGWSATAKEIRRPPRCAVRKSRGQEYPHTRKKKRKREEQLLAFAPRGPPVSRFSRLPHYPLIHPRGMSRFLIRSISHRPSHTRQF